MAAEHARQAAEQHLAAGHAGRGGARLAQEAAEAAGLGRLAAAAEQAAQHAAAALRLGRGVIALAVAGRRLLTVALLIARLLAIAGLGLGVALLRGRAPRRAALRLLLLAAAEEAGRAALARRLGAELGFEVVHPRLGGVQRLVGDDGVLHQHIGRIRVGADGAVDQVGGFGVLQPAAGLAQVLQEGAEEGAFFGSHDLGRPWMRGGAPPAPNVANRASGSRRLGDCID